MFLQVRSEVKYSIGKSEQDALQLEGVRSEQHPVAAGN